MSETAPEKALTQEQILADSERTRKQETLSRQSATLNTAISKRVQQVLAKRGWDIQQIGDVDDYSSSKRRNELPAMFAIISLFYAQRGQYGKEEGLLLTNGYCRAPNNPDDIVITETLEGMMKAVAKVKGISLCVFEVLCQPTYKPTTTERATVYMGGQNGQSTTD